MILPCSENGRKDPARQSNNTVFQWLYLYYYRYYYVRLKSIQLLDQSSICLSSILCKLFMPSFCVTIIFYRFSVNYIHANYLRHHRRNLTAWWISHENNNKSSIAWLRFVISESDILATVSYNCRWKHTYSVRITYCHLIDTNWQQTELFELLVRKQWRFCYSSAQASYLGQVFCSSLIVVTNKLNWNNKNDVNFNGTSTVHYKMLAAYRSVVQRLIPMNCNWNMNLQHIVFQSLILLLPRAVAYDYVTTSNLNPKEFITHKLRRLSTLFAGVSVLVDISKLIIGNCLISS